MPPLRFISPRHLTGPVYETIMALSRYLNLKLFGTSSVGLIGAPPPVDDEVNTFLVQSGTVIISTDSTGLTAQIDFPKPFPNGVLAVLAQVSVSATSASSGGVRFIDKAWFKVLTNQISHAGLAVSYIAVGW